MIRTLVFFTTVNIIVIISFHIGQKWLGVTKQPCRSEEGCRIIVENGLVLLRNLKTNVISGPCHFSWSLTSNFFCFACPETNQRQNRATIN